MVRIQLSNGIKNGMRYLFNVTLGTKILTSIILVLTLIQWALNNTNFNLALSAKNFLFQPWTIVTFFLIEKNLFALIVNVIALIGFGNLLENLWGTMEFMKFVFISNLLSSIFYCLFLLTIFAFTANQDILEIKTMGLTCLIASFTVALKQSYPEYKVKLFKAFGFKLKQLPSIFLLMITILSVIITSFLPNMILSWNGVFISWIYLRFFKITDGICGDRSETFSFVSFFPTLFRPPLKIVSNFCFNILVQLRICRPIHTISSYDLESGTATASVRSNPTPVHLSLDSERRKALALKALDERLRLSNPTNSMSSKSNDV
ncbi:DUF1751-domain-containing protein [Neoconidiobolus thromboides FSU 785]|nr:DUF1751-domain-containing protein [Neoconidiobolus thromboides FSU 785]